MTHSNSTTKTAAVLFFLGIGLFGFAYAQDDAPMMVKSRSGVAIENHDDPAMCNPNGIAVGGYDLLSSHESGGPTMGHEAFSVKYDGLQYLFSGEANQRLFRENPTHYLPAYLGYCAITLAFGRVTCPEYTNFQIENDQLLLFEVTGFTNGRTLWNSDATGFRRKADGNFDRLTELR